VPTPLGNLRDISARALDALRDCDLLVAEDTRVARRLLNLYGIGGKQVWSYREQNAAGVTAPILERARTERVVVVSDAGMPGVSDPGRELIVAARLAGIPLEVLPGPVAFVTAAVLSGFPTTGLSFEGFVPRSASARRDALDAALRRGAASAWYESPNRIAATLETLAQLAPEARVFIARELTKLHEQQILGTPAEALAALERPVRGEVVLVLEGTTERTQPRGSEADAADALDLDAAIDAAFARGRSVAATAKELAQAHGLARAEVYARAAARKRERGDRH